MATIELKRVVARQPLLEVGYRLHRLTPYPSSPTLYFPSIIFIGLSSSRSTLSQVTYLLTKTFFSLV